MYALIYDEHDLMKPRKRVISVHGSREEAETALDNRRQELNRSIEKCETRIVWTKCEARKGDYLTVADFETWRPGEKIPVGELYPDTD